MSNTKSPRDGSGPALVQDRERDLQLWSAQKWSAVTPPLRPSPAELAFYEKVLIDARLPGGSSALILGATPELRSLALKHGLRTTGCDLDANFWRAMTILRTTEGREEFLEANWLELPVDRRYDVILGDCALNMLTAAEMPAFVEKVSGILSDTGLSIQRMQTANESLTLESIGSAVEAYRASNPGISLNLYLLFLAQSLRSLYRPDLTHRQFYESIVFPHLTDQEIGGLRPFLIDKKLVYPRAKDLLALLEEHFVITQTEKSLGPGVWETARIYVLRNKRR